MPWGEEYPIAMRVFLVEELGRYSPVTIRVIVSRMVTRGIIEPSAMEVLGIARAPRPGRATGAQ
jgi:hypothetical protein